MNIRQAMATDLTDAVGASILLFRRFDRSFSVDSVHTIQSLLKIRYIRPGKLS